MSKLLVRVPQWLGDAVVSTVFLSRLKAKFPQSEIHVLSPAYLAAIFDRHPDVQKVIPLSYASIGSIFGIPQILGGEKYERAYVLPRSFRTALEMKLAGIPHRVGYAGDFRRLLLTHAIRYDSSLLYPHRYLKLIGEETFPLNSLHPFFPKDDLSLEQQDQLLGKPYADLKRPYWGLAPLSVAPARTWSDQQFIQLANSLLKKKGGTMFLFGSKNEAKKIASMRIKIDGPSVNASGKLDWAQLGGVLSQMDYFIGNDSGLMHVVSVFNIPSVILFGPSNPNQALPVWGRFTPLQNTSISCVPCLRNECVRFGSHYKECMNSISVDEVLSKIP